MPTERQGEAVPSARAERRSNAQESLGTWVYAGLTFVIMVAILGIVYLA